MFEFVEQCFLLVHPGTLLLDKFPHIVVILYLDLAQPPLMGHGQTADFVMLLILEILHLLFVHFLHRLHLHFVLFRDIEQLVLMFFEDAAYL